MRLLTLICFYGYVAVLLGAGGSGIFIAEWELATIFHLDLSALDEQSRSTMLNQYRFLKSVELGFGVLCILFRKEIFTAPQILRVFLIILFLGVGARTLSVIIDGMPHWAYIGFIVGEFITGVLVFIYTRQTLTNHD